MYPLGTQRARARARARARPTPGGLGSALAHLPEKRVVDNLTRARRFGGPVLPLCRHRLWCGFSPNFVFIPVPLQKNLLIRSQPPSQRQFHAKTHDFRRYLHRFWAMRTCWDRMSSFFFRVSKNKHRRTRHEFSRGHNLKVKPMYNRLQKIKNPGFWSGKTERKFLKNA